FAAYREALGEARPPAVYFAFAVLAEAAAGRHADALRLGEEGTGLHPHSPLLLLHLGAVRERRGEWEEAEALYRRAVEEDGSLPQAHKALGDALYRRGAYDEAAEAFGRAVQVAPALGDDTYFKLGNIHYKRMNREEAVRLWQRALEINPANHVVRTNLELVQTVLR
ncbi:MAG: tetratricopeptide repeat protein, partial [Gemmatimonadota bacterium]|nr:tetratricopeptide repeat protein [Gemmatimonadota bacterium]